MTFQIAIIQFPGSNCERETTQAVQRAGMQAISFLWNEPIEKLTACDGFIIVGGFSYEDRSRAGIIAALDPIMKTLKSENKLGKPILGICNGAQILVEAGLVPGLENHKLALSLSENKRIVKGKVLGTGYYNDWINLKLSEDFQYNAFTRCLQPNQILRMPVAHGEGRFIIPPALLAEIQENGLHVFQYCDEAAKIVNEFPINPNGSVENIAALSNKAGNVMAIMPHPERTTNGDPIFQSMRDYIEKGYKQKTESLYYSPRFELPQKYRKQNLTNQNAQDSDPLNSYEFLVKLDITDNHEFSVQNALHHLQIPARIKRYLHWEIQCSSPDSLKRILASEVLFNPRKERKLNANYFVSGNHLAAKPSSKDVKIFTQHFLIRAKEDMIGQQKKQMLEDHFQINDIVSIKYGIVWSISSANQNDYQQVLDGHLLYNPFAHEVFEYA